MTPSQRAREIAERTETHDHRDHRTSRDCVAAEIEPLVSLAQDLRKALKALVIVNESEVCFRSWQNIPQKIGNRKIENVVLSVLARADEILSREADHD